MSRSYLLLTAVLLLCPRLVPAQSPPPQKRFDIEGRIMVWADAARQPSGGDTKTTTDFLVRRARVVVQGRITERLSVYVHAGQDNLGAKLLTPDSGITIKDASANYRVHDGFQVTAGQFKVPFLRANLGSGFNQILIDRGTLPTLRPAREGSRDLGVMLWGNRRGVQYRFAVFDGSDQDYAFSGPRITARLAHNWFASEPAAGYTGTYLGSRQVLQVAVQADWQPERLDARDDAAFRSVPRDYGAYALEAFAEQPVGRWVITADAAWMTRRDDYLLDVPTRDLSGYYGQVGVLLPEAIGGKRVQLALRHENWDSERGAVTIANSRTTAGATYYISGHGRKLQADYTIKREGPEVDNDEFRASFVVVF